MLALSLLPGTCSGLGGWTWGSRAGCQAPHCPVSWTGPCGAREWQGWEGRCCVPAAACSLLQLRAGRATRLVHGCKETQRNAARRSWAAWLCWVLRERALHYPHGILHIDGLDLALAPLAKGWCCPTCGCTACLLPSLHCVLQLCC